MKKVISIVDINGIIFLYLSILYLAIGLEVPILAIVGLGIVPLLIICINRIFKISSWKYHISLIAIYVITFTFALTTSINRNTIKDQEQKSVSNGITIEEKVKC